MLIDDPVATVETAFAALRRQDWDTVARLIAADSLAQVQQMQLTSLVAVQSLPFNPEKSEPKSGGSMAWIQSTESLPGSMRIRVFPGAPTIAELQALSPADFFVRWQQACANVSVFLRLYSWIYGLFHRRRQALHEETLAVVGAVREGDDLAYVVYRQDGSEHTWERKVLTIRRDGSEWRVVLDPFPTHDPFCAGEAWLMMRMMGPRIFKERVKSWFSWRR